LGGPQRHTLLVGGARSGKTFWIVRSILVRATRASGSRHLIAKLHFNHVRATIWLDTLPKVARLCFPGLILKDQRADAYVSLPQYGSEIWFGGLDESDRVDKILGSEYATIFLNECSQIPYSTVVTVRTRLAQKVALDDGSGYLPLREYDDLNPTGARHWTAMEYLHKRNPITNRPLPNPDDFQHLFMNPYDNRENLPDDLIQELDNLPERQRRRFFKGEYSDEVEGALWNFETIDHCRCLPSEVPNTMREVVVAIDPSGTKGEEDERSDDVGIIVAGRADDGLSYVLADRTCNLPPEGWGRVVATAYDEFKADRVVGEKNFGGDMVRATIHAVDPNIPFKPVDASRGKAVRAEPVSALYGHEMNGLWIKDRVRHAGEFLKLEGELLDFSAAGYMGLRSPNRADALIWALTDLMLNPMKGWGAFEAARMRVEELQAKKSAPPQAQSKPVVYQPGSVEWQRQQQGEG
jgi:phage terminase large subunit-like protein